MDLCENGQVEEKHIKNSKECVANFYYETMPKIYKFVINLLCLMTQQPELISVQKSSTKYVATSNKGFGNHKVNNVPNVHWLGADFTTRVQYSKKIDTDPSDTISQGHGRLQKKLRWFEPVFIKGHKQEVTQ